MKLFKYRLRNYKGAGIALFREEPDKTFSVLLGKRKHNPGKNKWSFPGGEMETEETVKREIREETFEETAKREFLEETGVSLPEPDAKQIGVYKNNLPFFHWKTFLYTTKSNITFNKDKIREFSELIWVNKKEFLKLPKHLWVKSVYREYKKYRKKHRE
jgi:8-oxo-dGTP pyrophosphatase MutT (NUDIX family)